MHYLHSITFRMNHHSSKWVQWLPSSGCGRTYVRACVRTEGRNGSFWGTHPSTDSLRFAPLASLASRVKNRKKSIINNHDIDRSISNFENASMRISGVVEGVKQKKLLEYAKFSMNNGLVTNHTQKSEKKIDNHDIDRSISNFEKRHRCASMGWQRVTNKKKFARS